MVARAPNDLKGAIRAVLQKGPSTVPDIARAILPDQPDYEQRMKQARIREHLYLMERDGEVMSNRKEQPRPVTWWLS